MSSEVRINGMRLGEFLLLLGLALAALGCATAERCLEVVAGCSPPCAVETTRGSCVCRCPPAPSPSPTPVPTPMPQPTPTPTPVPTPQPTPTPVPPGPVCSRLRDCGTSGLQDSEAGIWGCCQRDRPGAWRFRSAVEAVYDEVVRRPGMLIEDEPGCPDPSRCRVASEDRYIAALVAGLRARGLCAERGGPEDEIAVKADDDWSEQYDVLWGPEEPTRRPWVNPTASCVPARF